MTRRLVLSYLSIAAFVLLVLEVPLGISFARAERERLTTAVERDAQVIGSLVEDQLQFGAEVVDPQLGDYPQDTGSRVMIVDRDGRIAHDSTDPDAVGRDYSTRPEIAEALTGQRSSGTRPSETLGYELLYVAIPVASGGSVHGAVRITYPTAALESRIVRNWVALAAVAAVVLVATALVGAAIARWVIRPTRQLQRAVGRFAAGDLDVRVPETGGPPEVRQLAHGFNTMAEQLSRLIRAQRAFVSDASHQLRSPLTALRLELEELELDADREIADGITRAIGETLRLSRLVDDLLALARADADTPRPVALDAAAVLRERRAVWTPLAAEQDVSLQIDTAAPTDVRVVAGHLEQIVDNLVDNAIAASPPGGTVGLSIAETDDEVEIHIADEGSGLRPEARARAFDRFWRDPEARPGTGSGLGLAIARQLAHLSDGEVELRERPAGGTDAVIRLNPAPAGHADGDGRPDRHPVTRGGSGR